MLISSFRHDYCQRGVSIIEVLVTIVILTFGLLGLAAFQSKTQLLEVESYQRAQAILLLTEMTERMNANRAQAANYVSNTILGTGDTSQPPTCTGLPAGVARDLCEWSYDLQGASEQKASINVGAVTGARGCITQLQAADPTPGVCAPGIYLVSVAWQGLHPTIAPTLTCGQNTYGADNYRRIVSTQVSVGLTSCS